MSSPDLNPLFALLDEQKEGCRETQAAIAAMQKTCTRIVPLVGLVNPQVMSLPDLNPLFALLDEQKEGCRETQAAIAAMQKTCTHEWQPDGNDSHYDYEMCRLCRKRTKS